MSTLLPPTSDAQQVQGITEADIANYLVQTPGFFERHAELLGAVQIASPHGQRAVSLQERQMEMLRERIKGLERKIMEMIRAGQDNMAIADRMHRWTCSVLLARTPEQLHRAMTEDLRDEFMVPLVALRIWGVPGELAHLDWTQSATPDVQTFAASLSSPYCGLNAGFEAAAWLGEGASVQSIAMIPLRTGQGAGQCFGLLVLGSPDALRYQQDMGTEFLEQVGDIASAALSKLR